MTHRSFPVALLLALSATLPSAMAAGAHAGGHDEPAIGEPGLATNASRSVQIDMSDAMRFNPASIDVKHGETIRFVVTNSGKLRHELVLGSAKALKAHNELMKKHPEMEHADPNMVTVAPGQTGEVVWRFTQAGRVDFACLQPGHFEAGMKGLVRVAAGTKADAATAPSDMAEGEVRKIDKDARKITLRHGELKALDMPPMTMVFQVSDPALLDSVKVGDKVRFKAEKTGGAFVVTAIEAAR